MDISTQPCHRVKNASHDSTSLTQKTIQEKKKKMRKSIDWKVGIFGLNRPDSHIGAIFRFCAGRHYWQRH